MIYETLVLDISIIRKLVLWQWLIFKDYRNLGNIIRINKNINQYKGDSPKSGLFSIGVLIYFGNFQTQRTINYFHICLFR